LARFSHAKQRIVSGVIQPVSVQEHAPAPAPVHVHLLDRGIFGLADIGKRQREEMLWLDPHGVPALTAAAKLDDVRPMLRPALPAVTLTRWDVCPQILAHAFLIASRWRRAASAARCESLRLSAM